MRTLRLILSLYLLLWCNVFVPAHTRGSITLPGSKSVTAGKGCCATEGTSEKTGKPTPQQQKHCAVCFVAAIWLPAPDCGFDLSPSHRLSIERVTLDDQVDSIPFPTPFWPTGPPALT